METDQLPDVIAQLVVGFDTALETRAAGWAEAGRAFQAFLGAVEASGHGLGGLVLAVVLAGLGAAGGTVALAAGVTRSARVRPAGRFLVWPAAAAVVLLVATIASSRLAGEAGLRAALLNAAAGGAGAAMACGLLLGSRRQTILRPWLRDLALAISVAAAGVVTLAVLRIWHAALPLRDLVATLAVSLPFTLLVSAAYLRHGTAVSRALAFGAPEGSLRRRLASAWPALAIACVGLAFLFTQLALTFGEPVRGAPLLLSVLLVLAGPHLDAAIELRSLRAIEAGEGGLAGALWRTLRLLVAATIGAVLLTLWLLPLLDTAGIPRHAVLATALEILLVVLVVALFWNWLSILAERLGRPRQGRPASGPASRLGTVGPLLLGLAKALLLVLGLLTVLVMLGVNVWPLITGLSIFGLAIGLGSQTLVKDIVAGLFFLFDDAFRLGEHILCADTTGTVEKIALRSVRLRMPEGAVATIPYGRIGAVRNFSREWALEKLQFRFAFDTDAARVDDLFGAVGQAIEADPALRRDLIEPFRSTGIVALEDGTIVIEGRFKTRVGQQGPIRRAILAHLQQALRENGIIPVPKPTAD